MQARGTRAGKRAWFREPAIMLCACVAKGVVVSSHQSMHGRGHSRGDDDKVGDNAHLKPHAEDAGAY